MSAFLGLLALCAVAPTPAEDVKNVLFLGNSQTVSNNLPALVASLLEGRIRTTLIAGGFLDDIWRNPETTRALNKTKWSYVVLQGAQLSSSHKYEYPNDGAVAIAKLAIKNGATPLFFVEWPRRGWDESQFQYDHYKALASRAGGGKLLPICWAWDEAIRGRPELDMWAADGNHAQLSGSYLAASVIAYWIDNTNKQLPWHPAQLSAKTATYLNSVAKATVERYRTD